MTTEKGYNGWTNYETWAAKLWMDNEEGSYRHWDSEAQDAWDDAEADGTFTRDEVASRELAEKLKEEHESAMPDVQGLFSDLLTAALSEVNWHEIAASLIEDVDKEEEADEEEETEVSP